MPDGVELALTLYLPAGDGPWPAVVESVPYRKDDDCYARDLINFAYLAEAGIVGVRVDLRGTGASTGIIEDEYLEREQLDNLEVLRWTAAQGWCTGRLGMWGISWGGFSALQTAMLRPSELKAIAVAHATHDRFACDVHYTGGSLHLAEQVDWPASMVALNALPPDPDIVGDRWFEEWMERLERTPQWLPGWWRHQQRDEFWMHGSPSADYSAITCPVLILGGWLDGYIDGMLALAENLSAPYQAVIGPWGHYRPATGVPAPTYDHFEGLARFFGHHLRGDDNGVPDDPTLRVFVRTRPPYDGERVEGRWRTEHRWPPADQESRVVELGPLVPPGSLDWDGPQWVGVHAPFWDRGGWGSTDSVSDDAASICFETAPFESEIEVLGTPEVELTVTVDRPAGMVAARLLLVDPDGAAHLITRGSRNLAHRDGLDRPSLIPAGQPIEVRFPLMATSAVVPAGWRLRLAIAGADFPIVWPPGERSRLTIDPLASRLILPTVPPRPETAQISVPEASVPGSPVTTLEDETGWSVERDGETTTVHRRSLHSELQPDRRDLTYVFRQSIELSVDDTDPVTSRGHADVETSLARPGWEVAAVATVDVTADSTTLHLAIDLVASHQGAEVWSRRWSEDVPRVWA